MAGDKRARGRRSRRTSRPTRPAARRERPRSSGSRIPARRAGCASTRSTFQPGRASPGRTRRARNALPASLDVDPGARGLGKGGDRQDARSHCASCSAPAYGVSATTHSAARERRLGRGPALRSPQLSIAPTSTYAFRSRPSISAAGRPRGATARPPAPRCGSRARERRADGVAALGQIAEARAGRLGQRRRRVPGSRDHAG